MNHKINPALAGLAIAVEDLVALPGNPRKGDVDAIAASYEEFGQNKPLVVRPNHDGTFVVVSGNHQLQAVRDVLGWTHVACVQLDGDEKRGMAYALADNQAFERGHTDSVLLYEALSQVYDDYADTFEVMGWDDFELASITESYDHHQQNIERDTGYTPAVLRQPGEPYEAPERSVAPVVSTTADGGQHLSAPPTVDPRTAVTLGATASGSAGSKSVVQYTLVFDSVEQQKRWYDFTRWLRTDPGTAGETTAERLLDFLESRADF